MPTTPSRAKRWIKSGKYFDEQGKTKTQTLLDKALVVLSFIFSKKFRDLCLHIDSSKLSRFSQGYMEILSGSLFLKKLLTKKTAASLKWLVSIVLLLNLATGCSEASLILQRLPFLIPGLSSKADFNITITPSGRPGIYTVAGNTNLPNQTSLTVAAIRYLKFDEQPSKNLGSNQTYSILAYEDIKVNKGKWEAKLNLWKIAPNGQFQETWQLDQPKLKLSFKPEKEVTFLVTVAPTTSLPELEGKLERQGIKLVSRLVRNTADGQRYIQVSQILPIALPIGKTTPPKPRPEDVNGGWGNRFLLIPEPPNINNYEKPKKRRTDAPLSPNELLQ